MGSTKKYWKGLEELNQSPEFVERSGKEFSEYLPVDEFLGDKETLENSSTTRRDFLKYLGFGVTAASLAACEAPIIKAVPYVNKPEEVNPGVANWYASTFNDGNDYASILVKTREGRPILIEGNKSSSVTKGGLNARIAASVLSLYDNNRLKTPLKAGQATSWATLDAEVMAGLGKLAAEGGKIRVLTASISSPSTQAILAEFAVKYTGADVKVVQYDAISYAGMIKANGTSFGKAAIPTYNFDKAKVIVSIGADFLGEWLNSIDYSIGYASNRKPENAWMSKHYQFETNLSLTGSNADERIAVKPSEQGKVALSLYNALSGGSVSVKTPYDEMIAKIAKELSSVKGESLVVAGSNNPAIQTVVNAINNLLGNYSSTIDLTNTYNLKQGSDAEVTALIKEMNEGAVGALLIGNIDPSYSLPNAAEFATGLAKVGLSVSFAGTANATSALCEYVATGSHYLESWSDANPSGNNYSLGQPVISPLFDSRQMEQSILIWSGSTTSVYDYIKGVWQSKLAAKSDKILFADFWNTALEAGVFELAPTEVASVSFIGDVAAAAGVIAAVKEGAIELNIYQKAGTGDGSQSSNPWLQELPDPITKITWDNYVTMNPLDAEEQGYATQYGQELPATTAKLTVGSAVIEEVPVVAQPGQKRGTIGIAVGYGKKVARLADITGVNAFPLLATVDGVTEILVTEGVKLEKIGNEYPIASTQTHHTIMGRDAVVKETTFGIFKTSDKQVYNPTVMLATHDGPVSVNDMDLWGDHPIENVGHRWGMSIDLNTCTGCSACVINCHAENNVPVVGKDEVRRGRDMHWLRIDRYYSTDADTSDKSIGGYRAMERPSDENPSVVHQPMMCQHCNHAGCETVCPVAATTHSTEGLNQMTYNRCIGTRYCANNCAYKVRRFNWFNYVGYSKFADVNPSQDDLGRMVLNPDIVVRARGVMEKCSLCVQRIQEGKLNAKKEGRTVKDGEIQTACAAACSTGAIKFGDLNDKVSVVRKGMESDRAFRVIEEVGTQPNIYYQTLVRNKEEVKA